MIPIVETDRALPLVQLSLASLRGASEDPPGKEGLTRLLTRLMRRTASGLDPNTVDERIDAMGASLSADVSYSGSGFSGSVLRRSLDRYVDLLRGALRDPGFDPNELEKLKRETLAEIIEHRDDDRTLARIWFRKTLFEGHPYGRGVVGTTQSIQSITLDDVKAAYQQIFVDGSYSGAFAGDIDDREASDVLRAICPNGTGPRASTRALVPPLGLVRKRLLIVDKPERTQTQILIGGLGTHPKDPDHTALNVANTVFGGTFTARLTQEVRAKRGWSYGAYSSLPIERQRQAFSMWTFPSASDAAACVELELSMLQDWVDNGITQEELDWAKHYLIRSHVFSEDTAAKRMSLAQDETLLDLPPEYYSEYPSRVDAVTLEQANAAVQQRIDSQHLLIVVLGTEADVGAALRKVVPADTEVNVVRYDEE